MLFLNLVRMNRSRRCFSLATATMQKFAAVANALYSTSSKRANRCSFVKCCATTQTLGLANAGPWHGLSLETTTFPVSCTQSALRDGLQSSNRASDSEACYALRDVVGASRRGQAGGGGKGFEERNTMMPFARSGRQQPAVCGVFSIRVNEEQQRLMLLQCSALTCRYQCAHVIALNTP